MNTGSDTCLMVGTPVREPRKPRLLEVTMLRRRSDEAERCCKCRWNPSRGDRPDANDYATTLMLAAVVSAAGNAAAVLIEIGRSAGWWH